jgi:hypothetical protein
MDSYVRGAAKFSVVSQCSTVVTHSCLRDEATSAVAQDATKWLFRCALSAQLLQVRWLATRCLEGATSGLAAAGRPVAAGGTGGPAAVIWISQPLAEEIQHRLIRCHDVCCIGSRETSTMDIPRSDALRQGRYLTKSKKPPPGLAVSQHIRCGRRASVSTAAGADAEGVECAV